MQQPPSIFPALLAFLAVLALIPVVLWFIKRLQQGLPQARQRLIKIAGGLPLGPKERIVIIEADGRRWMVGVTSQSIAVLAELSPPAPDAAPSLSVAPASATQGFAAVLERLRRPAAS